MAPKKIYKNLSELEELKISVPNTEDYLHFFEKQGYIKCSGSAAYHCPYITVMPFAKKYWEDNIRHKVLVQVHEKEVREIKYTMEFDFN